MDVKINVLLFPPLSHCVAVLATSNTSPAALTLPAVPTPAV